MYEALGFSAGDQEPFGSPDAWGAYFEGLRVKLASSKSSAVAAYNTLKQVRQDLGLPFSTAKSGEGYADLGAWPEDYEQQAVDVLAMTKICLGAADDVLSSKRKLLWDDKTGDFAIEGFASDPLRLVYGSKGQVVLVDSSNNETHGTGQVGLAPIAILGLGALAVVQGIGIYLIVDKALDTLQVIAEQKTQKTLAEVAKKHADLVAQNKATPAEVALLNTSVYKGAAGLQSEMGASKRNEKETSDIAKAVTTIAWVGLGVGVLYVVAQVLKGGALGMPALAGARDNPLLRRGRQNLGDYTQFRSSYLPPALRDVTPFTPSGTDLEIWTWETEKISAKTGQPMTMFHGIAFAGKAGKPLWHNWFVNSASRMKMITDSIANRKSHLKWREERTGARKDFKHTLKVGDVLYTSWGYDETHVDFYQVVEVKDKSVVVCKISKTVDHSSTGADYVKPVAGSCRGKTSLHRVGEGNSVKIDDHFAGVFSGKPVYETASGWGH